MQDILTSSGRIHVKREIKGKLVGKKIHVACGLLIAGYHPPKANPNTATWSMVDWDLELGDATNRSS